MRFLAGCDIFVKDMSIASGHFRLTWIFIEVNFDLRVHECQFGDSVENRKFW